MKEKFMVSKIRVFITLIIFSLILTSSVIVATGNSLKHISFSRIYDLSHNIDESIPLWPGDPEVVITDVATIDIDGYFLRKYTIGEHSATHMNAPNCFFKNGISIDAYQPEDLIVPAVIMDIRDKTMYDDDYMLTIQDILDWESIHGKVPCGHMVILYTGWQEKWSTPLEFMNVDSTGTPHFPGFSGDATRFLLNSRNIAGVGTDTHGVDPGIDFYYETNTEVLSKNKIVLECLTNLDRLPTKGITLSIGILRLTGGSGSQVAVTAFVK